MMDLHQIANTPGFGTGKRMRDKLAEDAACRANLPEPSKIAQVMARPNDAGHLLLIASFGNSSEDGQDWSLYHEGSDDLSGVFGWDAKHDAQSVANIVNAYRLGILVVKP